MILELRESLQRDGRERADDLRSDQLGVTPRDTIGAQRRGAHDARDAEILRAEAKKGDDLSEPKVDAVFK